MSGDPIPIQNIYYLLSYAWNKLPEAGIVNVEKLDCTKVYDLLAKVLVNGACYVLRRGLDRGYVDMSDDITRIRGKIDFNCTMKTHGYTRTSLVCQFDEFDHDILHNQIVKTTVYRLLKCSDIDKSIRSELMMVYRRFEGVTTIALRKRHFGLVQLNSNNHFYDFLLKVCELIFDCLLVSEKDGTSKFRDFVREDRMMASLFEEFIRNFYKREQDQFEVKRENIPWRAEALTERSENFLPRMQTDVSLESSDRKIIIDAKYYKETLQRYYDKEKIHSSNLYQLWTYVSHLQTGLPEGTHCEGVLLYPTVTNEQHHSFSMYGHRISIYTLNLDQDWRGIHKDLMAVLE